ncbi:MAG TPA: PEP-CTERM sorting domain-containing protein [Tepidisphaeraceae bacterium]|nr:PEP-CTERM sorting domain-containing protein [Tepidisphaeraceae bacterium]
MTVFTCSMAKVAVNRPVRLMTLLMSRVWQAESVYLFSLGGRMNRFLLCAAAVSVLSASTVSMAAFTYDFNAGQTDFTNNFSATGNNSVLPTNGLSGGGGLDRTTGGGAYVYYKTSLGQFTTAGQTASLSYYFLGSANNTAGVNDFLGFSTNIANGNPTSTNNTNNIVAGVKAQLVNNALVNSAYSNTSSRIETSNNSGSGLVATAGPTTFTLPVNGTSPAQWFYQTLSLTYNGSGSFDVATSLHNSSNTGAIGTLLDSYSVTRTGLTSLENAPIYGGFQVFSGSNSNIRAGAADNFTANEIAAVPEPTSLAALGLAGLLGLRRRARSM